MANRSKGPSVAEREQISRLVGLARERGQADIYCGKRRWARYNLGLRLEMTTDPADSSPCWSVIMHNVSAGGVGLWSKRDVPLGARVLVREWSHGNVMQWLPGRVSHCTVGLQGYLVGVAFDRPALPDRAVDRDTPSMAGVSAGRTHRSTFSSLRTRSVYAPATAGAVAVVATALVSKHIWPSVFWPWPLVLALVFGLVGLVGWAGLRREVRCLEGLREAIRRLARGESGAPPPLEPVSRELAGVRQAFLDLAANWQQREDAGRFQRQRLEELNQVKSNILSIVSHDLRTPLTSILLYTQMLTEELGELAREDQERFLQIISAECTRLSRLVDDLLEVQRLESGRVQWRMEPQDLSKTILGGTRLFEAMAQSKSIQFTVDCPPSLPPVTADSDKISQVLSNLLSNAMKYTPSGGKVHVSVEVRGSELLLRVLDNGPGIPRDKWDQIFDRFSQLSDPNVREIAGVGLGLSIVRQIVERHGGSVWVDSEVGRGSEFSVSLPIEGATPAAAPKDEVESRGRVLVCDADPELASTMGRTLRHAGFDVRVVHSACRLLAQLAHGETDVVVTDMLLPDMNATGLFDALGSIHGRSFSLVIHSYVGEAPDLRRRGVDFFLRRPATTDELIQAVRVAAQRRSAAGMTVVIVESDKIDVKRLTSLLSNAGHLPVGVASLSAAAALVRDYAIDAVLASSESLRAEWDELKALGVGTENTIRVIALCDGARRMDRRLAADNGITPMPYRRGSEEVVVAAIAASQRTAVAEPTR